MGKLMDVEQASFSRKNIELYAGRKVGQYSKFLDKYPIFVTYYSVNAKRSRTDIGTGGIQSERGKDSPLRYNKITEFPIYNIPDLRPEVNDDEMGYDVGMELNDITLLPGTIHPQGSDYILLVLPNAKECLFRVNRFGYNTIQSNDFYQVDIDVQVIGTNLESILEDQVVEEYRTVFSNIGTQDKCFLRVEDFSKLVSLEKSLDRLKEDYLVLFYEKEVDAIAYRDAEVAQGDWLYDPYLERFLMATSIYYVANRDTTFLLTGDHDVLPMDADYLYTRTLWYAIQHRTLQFLNEFPYFYTSPIAKTLTPFYIMGIPTSSVHLHLSEKELSPLHSEGVREGILHPYFDHQLIQDLFSCTSEETDLIKRLIFSWMMGTDMKIDINELESYPLKKDEATFFYMPILLFLLNEYYKSYFMREDPSPNEPIQPRKRAEEQINLPIQKQEQ